MDNPEPERQGANLTALVDRLSFRNDLSDEDRRLVAELPFKLRRIEAQQYIVRDQDRVSHCALIMSGFAVRHKIVADGARQILSIHMAGEMVDLPNSFFGVADHNVQMLTAGEVALIPRDDVIRLAFDRPAIGKALWIDTLVDASILREWMAGIGRRNARLRLSHLLCEFAVRMRNAGLTTGDVFALPMTQDQLADATGLTPVHVNRTLKTMENEGLISRSKKRTIGIGDWRRLAEVCEFDPAYLHLRDQEPALA